MVLLARGAGGWVVSNAMTASEREIRTFDPLLRDLLTWGLVFEDDERWVLADRVADRLRQLAAERGPWPSEQTVYFDHRCAMCDTRRLTRFRDGDYVCDSCWRSRAVATPRPAEEAPPATKRRRILNPERRRVPHTDRRTA
jgi:ribosomal protein L37AE/L43A